MSVFLLGIVSLVFGLISFVYEFIDIKRNGSIRLVNIFCLMYSLTYGFLTSIILLSYEFFGMQYMRIIYTSHMLNALWLWGLLSFLGYITVRVVYCINLGPAKATVKLEDKERDNERLLFTSFACLVIGAISLYLWARVYGGIFELIKVANAVRSGWYDVTNSLAFFKHPSKILTMTSYISIVLIKRNYKKFLNFALFAISFFLSVLYLLGGDGRMSMAMYLVIVFLIVFGVFEKSAKLGKKIFLVFLVAASAIALMMSLDFITNFIRTGEGLNSVSESFAKALFDEFAYVIVAGQNSANQFLTEGSPLLIIDDIVSGIFAWVPSSLKPDGLINIWDYNTKLCYMSSLMSGQWPTDFVSTSIYTLGPLGIFAFAIFWGVILKFIDNAYCYNKNSFFEVVYYSLSMSFLRLVDYCMLYNFVLGVFYLFVAFVIWKASKLFISSNLSKEIQG